ncbi:MAG: HlyD family efflux transporter periplasmic adaptor subunit [Alphaproteobacteria bacterium]|nr:HlyD family efflux transporter periplasmic adaptor subunit [Alphaproteobacteria bacterium]
MAVTIRRERADQRRHHRLLAPLFVEVLGHRLRVADWSLGGLHVEQFPDQLPSIGTPLELALTLPFQGFDVSFRANAKVVRLEPERRKFAVHFIDLGERERELMAHFVEDLVRGHMGEAADTIQRIDFPVTPASLKPGGADGNKPQDPFSELARLPARRWPLRTFAAGAFYIVLGMLVFSYAAILAYSNVFRLEVPTAVISAPAETVRSKADGRVEFVGLKPGDSVRSGEILLHVKDDKLERDIEIADIAIKEREARLNYLRQRHLEELERVQGYASIETKNLHQSRLTMEAVETSLSVASDQYARLRTLYKKGFVTQSRHDEAFDRLTTLEKRLASQRIEHETRAALASADMGKRLYNGDELVGRAAEMGAEVQLAEREMALTRQRYEANLRMRDNLAVRAPFDGTILKLPRFDKVPVRQGDVIAVLEQRRDRQVTAFLTQHEVAKIGQGDPAILYVPALGETLSGRVIAIDRTSGFIDEQGQRTRPGYVWRGPADRSAEVTIGFDDDNDIRDHERYRSGLPVTVIFERRAENSILSGLVAGLRRWL